MALKTQEDDDDFDDDPYDDLDEFNPHRETESRYPQISQPQSNEAIDEDQISNIEQLENLLQPSNSIATAVITNLCIVCSTQVNAGSFIACSNCFKNIHYLCNNPVVTPYYKKNTKNFKCHICKPIKKQTFNYQPINDHKNLFIEFIIIFYLGELNPGELNLW